jgi:hypothetical protein
VKSDTTTFQNCTFSNNSCGGRGPGGAYVNGAGTIVLIGCTYNPGDFVAV